jgi:hypothetical protein
MDTHTATGFARLTPWGARHVLAGWLLATIFCVAVTLSPLARNPSHFAGRGPGDAFLYRAVADRIAGGESFYDAFGRELSARGYPTRSVFNWRMPLPLWLIGTLPYPWGKLALGLLAMAALGLGFELLLREAGGRITPALGGGLLLIGPLLFCALGDLYVMPVIWAGVSLAVSVSAYGLGWRRLGLAAGLSALFCRELALPYALLSAGIAWRQRRRGETLVWIIGLALWAAYFVFHAAMVARHQPPGGHVQPHGWLQLGGIPFVLSTVQVNAYLLLLPPWVTALYFAAALLALASWNTPAGLRIALTVSVFVMAFGFVGQEFNQYWGTLTAPLFALAVARFPRALGDCWRKALQPA